MEMENPMVFFEKNLGLLGFYYRKKVRLESRYVFFLDAQESPMIIFQEDITVQDPRSATRHSMPIHQFMNRMASNHPYTHILYIYHINR